MLCLPLSDEQMQVGFGKFSRLGPQEALAIFLGAIFKNKKLTPCQALLHAVTFDSMY